MSKLTFFVSLILFSVTVFGQTTLEEYNYVTKGYKVQIESGLDMKSGYRFEDIDKIQTEERTVELKSLIKGKGTPKTIAGYLLIYTREGSPVEYICIPNPLSDSEVMQKYYDQLYIGVGDSSYRLQLILVCLSKFIQW